MSYLKCFVLLVVGVTLGCTKTPPDPAQMRADETALVQATVADPARAQTLLSLLDERDRLIEETTQMLRHYRLEMQAINADYDASTEDIVAMIDDYNRDRSDKQTRFIELIKRMKAQTNAAEWKVIASYQLDNLTPRQLVYGRKTGEM